MLIELKRYLSQRPAVSLHELTVYFNVGADFMRELLGHWIRKGRVVRNAPCGGCGSGCGACNPALTEFYTWVEAPSPDAARDPLVHSAEPEQALR